MMKHEANQYKNMMKRIEQCSYDFIDDIEDDSIKKVVLSFYEITKFEMQRYYEVYVNPFVEPSKDV